MKNALHDWLLDQPKGKGKELAEYLGVSQSHLSQARLGIRKIRTSWMEDIERFTGGVVTVEQMVRDITVNERSQA